MTLNNEQKPAEINVVVEATPNTLPAIPNEWAALGVTSGYNPRSAEDLRLWIVGPSGEGKTTLLSSIPHHIILDFDDRADGIPGGRAYRVKIKDYGHYEAITDKLIADAKNKIWKRVSFDTVDEWIDLIITQLQKEKNVEDIMEFGSHGHGVSLVRNRCWSKIKELEDAGYTWSCVGHLTTKTELNPVDKREYTKIRESIFPSIAKKITTKSDFKLTVYCLPEVINKTKKKQLSDGRIIEVPDGTETVYKYFVDSLTTAEKEGKSSGVPLMKRKIRIPLIDGWKIFAEEYLKAMEATKQQYSL